MRVEIRFLLCAVFVAFCLAPTRSEEEKDLARGWGERIRWVSLSDSYELSKRLNAPIMVIIHKTWCGACRSLKKLFAEAKDIEAFSSSLVMVNLEDNEEPNDPSFSPDGAYVPRIFFISPSTLKVDATLLNEEGNKDYKYFYYSTDHVLASMKRAVAAATKTEL